VPWINPACDVAHGIDSAIALYLSCPKVSGLDFLLSLIRW
jgi:hypothetical protein